MDQSTRVLLCGDTIITRALDLSEKSLLAGVRRLLKSADVRFTNLEAPFNGYAGSPNANEIIHLSTDPEMAKIVAELGFNLCSGANNHALDYGTEGLLRSMNALKEAKVLYAGIGHDLWQASRPVYLDVSGGRFALNRLHINHGTWLASGQPGTRHRRQTGRKSAQIHRSFYCCPHTF